MDENRDLMENEQPTELIQDNNTVSLLEDASEGQTDELKTNTVVAFDPDIPFAGNQNNMNFDMIADKVADMGNQMMTEQTFMAYEQKFQQLNMQQQAIIENSINKQNNVKKGIALTFMFIAIVGLIATLVLLFLYVIKPKTNSYKDAAATYGLIGVTGYYDAEGGMKYEI